MAAFVVARLPGTAAAAVGGSACCPRAGCASKRTRLLVACEDREREPTPSDWDKAWSKFQQEIAQQGGAESKGSGIRLPSDPDAGRPGTGDEDSQARLLDAWSNDKAFLVALVGVGALLVFYLTVIFSEQSQAVYLR